MKKSRTYTWDEPMATARAAGQLSGAEYLRFMLEGRLAMPPLLQTLDFHAVTLEPGKTVFAFRPQEFHYNPLGCVHGGVITALLDTAMGCALHSVLEAGRGYTTLELKVNFLKAATVASGELRATGIILHAGGRTALVEAKLTDAEGKLFAHGVSTCLIVQSNPTDK